MERETTENLERLLKAVANRRRLAILKYLKGHNEASVSELSRNIKLSFRSTSKHLAILAARDLVEKEQKGLRVFYRLPAILPAIIKHPVAML